MKQQQNYHYSFTAGITPAEAFDGITRVSEWWTADLEGSTKMLNDVFSVHFGETSSIIRLVELIPDRKIVWKIEDCHLHFLRDKKEWKDTRIIFNIINEEDRTTVEMTHEGLVPGIECYANCETGWNHYIGKSLYELLTTGKGLPDAGNGSKREKDAAQRRAPRAVAEVATGLILATADVAMPPDRVYRALTEAREIETWWGSPEIYRMTDWKADTRVGGQYTVVVQRPDGNAFPASGKFLELEPMRRIVHTRKYEWDHPTLHRRETIITYHLDPVGDGTRVTVRHEGFSGCAEAAYEHAEGWERVLGWLDHYLYYQYYFPKN